MVEGEAQLRRLSPIFDTEEMIMAKGQDRGKQDKKNKPKLTPKEKKEKKKKKKESS
jgi:hypothetical protein